MKPLSEREAEVLEEIKSTNDWVRPMDIGGRDSSDHSHVLKRLADKGYIERRRRNTLMNALGSHRGSYEYRYKTQ